MTTLSLMGRYHDDRGVLGAEKSAAMPGVSTGVGDAALADAAIAEAGWANQQADCFGATDVRPLTVRVKSTRAPDTADNLQQSQHSRRFPKPRAMITLLKPITWFPPMWAYMCGIVSSGTSLSEHWADLLLGVALAGPLVCGTSQVVNDWFDRHVDAINEPQRPIPSGDVPGRWGLYYAVVWTALSLWVAYLLGPVMLIAATGGLALAWAYSAPPFRLKNNGWFGNLACGLCYEGLPWFTAAAIMAGGIVPATPILVVALLYSLGAFGIMTINDFKAIKGDIKMGVRTLPVQLGADRAARITCTIMLIPQFGVGLYLASLGHAIASVLVAFLILMQALFMKKFLRDPEAYAPWYNGTGVTSFVLGMLVSALAFNGILAGGL